MKKNSLHRLGLTVCLLLGTLSLFAQGIVVYQNDGTKEVYYYNKLDSIVTFEQNVEDDGDKEDEEIPETQEMKVAEAVDLGLPSRTMWASWNMGASSPEECGNYYAWGETEPKEEYSSDTYKYYDPVWQEYQNIGADISGTEYDVAHMKWGDGWCMPTQKDIQELLGLCEWKKIEYNGEIPGYRVTGPNGNKIFLPAMSHDINFGDRGWYWSSTLDDEGIDNPFRLEFYSSVYELDVNGNERFRGSCIRPVKKKQELSGVLNGHEWVDLGLPSGLKWATCNIGANSPEDYGDYFAWGETSTKLEYTEENSVTYEKNFSDIAGDSRYDAARANWGGTWRLPTEDECRELNEKCTWTWITKGGHNGYNVVGPNGNSIFLPATGWRDGTSLEFLGESGNYWSSAPVDKQRTYNLGFINGDHGMAFSLRCRGLSVRPVSE